jgi:hypothetical protein
LIESSVHNCTSPAAMMRAVHLGGAEHELGEGRSNSAAISSRVQSVRIMSSSCE